MIQKKEDVAAQLISNLRANIEAIRQETKSNTITAARRNRLNQEIQKIGFEVEELLRDLDPIKLPPAMFDPANPNLVGRFIALALVAQPLIPLMDIVDFYGAGVYAIYYRGSFDAYQPISGKEVPIYVGKADPDTAIAKTPIEQKVKLSARLKEHRKSISKAHTTLKVADFHCRYLVVQSGWEKPAESFLINFFNPVWNNETGICFGLGKHGDAAETRANKRSPWDTIHAGRTWAAKTLQDAMPETTIRAKLTTHFSNAEASNRLFSDRTDVLNAFIEGLKFS